MTILAALDDSAAAGPVLATACRIGSLLDTTVEAVHIGEDGTGGGAAAVAEAAGVKLHRRAGDVCEMLRAEVADRGATVLVLGARGDEAGATPAGHVALDLVQSVDCTIAIVPPGAADRPLRRVLVATEAAGESRGLKGLFRHLGRRPTPEVVALHVIEPSSLPLFADSPILEADAFKREFGIRASGTAVPETSRVQFETRVGDAPEALGAAVHELDADLVVLAWHRDLSEGHGRMVRAMLAATGVPIVLIPLERTGPSSSRRGPTGTPGD
jgi:hypothetical protein